MRNRTIGSFHRHPLFFTVIPRLVRGIHPSACPVLADRHPSRGTVDRPHKAGDDGGGDGARTWRGRGGVILWLFTVVPSIDRHPPARPGDPPLRLSGLRRGHPSRGAVDRPHKAGDDGGGDGARSWRGRRAPSSGCSPSSLPLTVIPRLVRGIHPSACPVLADRHPSRGAVDRPHKAGDDGGGDGAAARGQAGRWRVACIPAPSCHTPAR